MQNNKKMKFFGSMPEQSIEPKVEKVEITEEEEKKKKGIIAWIKKHKKGVTITGIGVGLALLLFLPQCHGQEEKTTDEQPTQPGYEDIQDDQNNTQNPDENDNTTPEPVETKKGCMCTDQDCLCDDDDLGCLCKDGEHEEDCIANVITTPNVEEKNNTGVKKPTESTGKQQGEQNSVTGIGNGSQTETKEPPASQTETKEPSVSQTEKPTPQEGHTHDFGEWKYANDYYEKRTCACGKTEVRAHEFVEKNSVYTYMYSDKHYAIKTSECSTCGFSKKNGILESCDYTITSFNTNYEYLTCDDCKHKITRKHVLDKGTVQKDGSTLYTCTHEGCDYAKTIQPSNNKPVETKPVETKPVETDPVETDPVETKPVETDPVETKPVETDPVETNPVETDPVETDPVETDPVETDPVETDPGKDDNGDEDNRGDYESGDQDESDRGETDKDDTIVPDDGDDDGNDDGNEDENEDENGLNSEGQKLSEIESAPEQVAGLDEEETSSMSSVHSELQALYTMREMIVEKVTFEYPVLPPQEFKQKKLNKRS